MGVVKILKKNFAAVIFVAALVLAFTPRLGEFRVDVRAKYVVAVCIVLLAFVNWFKNRGKNKEKTKDLWFFAKLYLAPVIVIHLYSIVMSLIGVMDIKYLSTNASAYLPVLLMLSGVYLFGKKTFKYSLVALAITWILFVMVAVVMYGFGVFLYAIMQGYFGESTPILGVSHNLLEIHDLVLTTSCIIVSFVFLKLFGDKEKRRSLSDRIIIIIVVAAFLLGLKRISLLAVGASVLFLVVMKRVPERVKKKLNVLAGVLLMGLSFGYVALLFNGNDIYKALDSYGVDMKGRDFYYQAIVSRGEFSPTFFGTGRNSVGKMMEYEYSYMGVAGVHNDLLKMYVENGFILFLLWMAYYVIFMSRKYDEKYGVNVTVLYMSLTICTFILYTTDNVENYFMYQLFYTMIPVVYALGSRDKKPKYIAKKTDIKEV